ncbi:MAG: HAD family hydrolase, partial [Sphingosinicella sp.]
MTELSFDALILDFDGVLIESEYAGNKQVADYLSAIGHPIGVEEAMHRFMGLGGRAFIAAIEQSIGRPLPDDFEAVREAEDARVLADGLEEVAGAIAFVRALPPQLPRAIASSSSVEWVERHLEHLGLG